MSIIPLALVFLVLLVLSLLVNGAFLWFGARLGRIPNATYRRSLLAMLVAYLFGWLLTALAAVAVWNVPGLLSPSMEWPFLAVQIVVTIVSIKWVLHTTWGKTFLAWMVSFLLASVYAAALVFVLKTWILEGFVIPTGGMAETIRGYHKSVDCPQCGHVFAVNASAEADPFPPGRSPRVVVGCTCPNCRYGIDFRAVGLNPALETGDRILVPKLGHGDLQRLQPVVFRYPVTPVLNGVPMIYVKRLVGLPGETIAIHRGKLYTYRDISYDWRDRPASAEAVRETSACYVDDNRALEAFQQGKFEIIRKPPDTLLALSRLVYDNDEQARDLAGKQPPRWTADKDGWNAAAANQPRRFDRTGGEKLSWLRYRHVIRTDAKPSLITDFSGNNSGRMDMAEGRPESGNWVGDLILECRVALEKPEGELRLELCKGVDRFQACFALGSGECTLVRLGPGGEKELAKAATAMSKRGEYRLRFANVDDRLTVWVDDGLPFGDGISYEPPQQKGPVAENDLTPAGVGAQLDGVTVSRLVLRRDTYYTLEPSSPDTNLAAEAWGDPSAWGPLQELRPRTFYVQPGHYFCMGDNSPQSADSRVWGLVPEANILGPALLTYWPLSRSGWVR